MVGYREVNSIRFSLHKSAYNSGYINTVYTTCKGAFTYGTSAIQSGKRWQGWADQVSNIYFTSRYGSDRNGICYKGWRCLCGHLSAFRHHLDRTNGASFGEQR